MSQPVPEPWTLDEFFAWQSRQDDRYELVGGRPVRMMVGVTNRHDRIVVNLIASLVGRLRGTGCAPFTGEHALETYPGQIRRPDVGVDCGSPGPDDYQAAEPRVVIEVLSPSTRDFDTIGKLAEYKAVESLRVILYVEPTWPEVRVWSREGSGWVESCLENLSDVVELSSLGIGLPLGDIYDGIDFPATRPRLMG